MNTWSENKIMTTGAGLVGLSDATLVEISGLDRAAFLHNLCTNEIRKLPVGAGCEAFLLNVQGKILFYVLVFSGADSLVLSTDLGQQGMMTPPDGIENEIAAVLAAGVSQADIDKMMKRNPAQLLGLVN